MLPYLRTIHHPTSLEEAARLLENPDVQAIYGGALARDVKSRASGDAIIEEAVQLTGVGLDSVGVEGGVLKIGSTATLESVRILCLGLNSVAAGAIAEALAGEYPATLRNALTPGDVISEANPQSLLLTLFAALGPRTRIERLGRLIVARYVTLDQAADNAGYAIEKVARTPKDAPIVGAVAWVENDVERVAVCGLGAPPGLYVAGQTSTLSDYLGSAEYRTEMAKVLTRRAAERAQAMAGNVGR